MTSAQRTANNAVLRSNTGFSWRSSFLLNVANDILRRTAPVLDSLPSTKNRQRQTTTPPESAVGPSNNNNNNVRRTSDTKSIKNKCTRNTVVNIVLVEAKGLPDVPNDGLSHGIHCKFKLGSQIHRSKAVASIRHPQWRERFKLNSNSDELLHISLWDKGKQKNFMGSCVLELSTLEKERTHDIWLELDEGYGSIHISVTICTIRNTDLENNSDSNAEDLRCKYAFYSVPTDLEVVGQLHVKVIGAKGLYGRPNPYCTLELDNEKIQTPNVSYTPEPMWNKSYIFNIFDVSSVLEVKVHDSSLQSLLNDFLGRVSIPLLRINDGEARWYALKDNSKRRNAKGNYPRIRLEMSLYWHPVTASLKLFRPKQVKYIAKQPKFDVALVYKNMRFIRDTFDFLYRINESFKRLFEWDDRELNYLAVSMWLIFWFYFEAWMIPLFIVGVFPLTYFYDKRQSSNYSRSNNLEEPLETVTTDELHNGETITEKIVGLPEMTLTITKCIEYKVSVAERLYNLAAFKVPFLSYLTIVLLIAGAGVIYLIPFKFLMMIFGLYKFLRKWIHPNRVLNNDLLDFISRLPDNKILKDWKEFSVPEPQQKTNCTNSNMARRASEFKEN